MTTPPIAGRPPQLERKPPAGRVRRSGRRRHVLGMLVAALALGSAGSLMFVPTADAAGLAGSPGSAGGASKKPHQCASSDTTNAGVRVAVSDVPTTVAVPNTLGSTVAVTVSFPSTEKGTSFALSAANSFWRLDDATWCVTSAASSGPISGSGLTGTSPATNKNGAPHRIRYVTVYSVTATHLLGSTVTCYGQTPFGYDFSWNGETGQTNNAVGYDSTDGSCRSNGAPFPVTLVLGNDEATALANCTGLYPGYEQLFRVWNAKQAGYTTAPANVWVCTDQV